MWKLGSIGGFPGDVISDLRFSGFMKGFKSVTDQHPNVKIEVLPMKFGELKPDKALTPIRDMATANQDNEDPLQHERRYERRHHARS